MPELKPEKRCECGKLLFKRTKHGFEFKCHRCKRIHLIPFDRFDLDYQNLCPAVNVIQEPNSAARDLESSALSYERKEGAV